MLTEKLVFKARENFSNCVAGIGPHHTKLSHLGDEAPGKFPSLFCTMNLKQQIKRNAYEELPVICARRR
jgi:hypothetical protein